MLAFVPSLLTFSAPSAGSHRVAKQQQFLLQSKRPLGRRQLGYEASSWLKEEMRQQASAYLGEVLFADPSTEREERLTGRVLAETFSPSELEAHLHRELEQLQLSPEQRPAHELAAQHTPTLWAAFQLAVQTALQKRSANESLAETPDWRIFLHLQQQASPAKAQKRQGGAAKPQKRVAMANARARDAARRASVAPTCEPSAVRRQPYGRQTLGAPVVAWLREAAAECADEYCEVVGGVRTEQLSGLVQVLGSGEAGTSAVLSVLNTEAVSAR